MNINELIKEELNNSTMTFFHGGNLDSIDHDKTNKNKRYELGVGLYLTDKYEVVKKYHKGNRKLYYVEVAYGNNLEYCKIDYNNSIEFINRFVIQNKRKTLIDILDKHVKDDKIPGYILNNIIINYNALSQTNTNNFRRFLVDNNIDYLIVNNYFGYGDKIMALFNYEKIKSINRIDIKTMNKFEIDNEYKKTNS